jgi:FMN-dependent NADH-azoreductase
MIKFIKNLFNNKREEVKMSKVLYITANPKSSGESYGLSVGDAFIEKYRRINPKDEIVNIDLFNMEVPFIDEVVFSAWGKLAQGVAFEGLNSEEQKKLSTMNVLLEQFMEADKYVFVTPLWNFTVPARMKAYLDIMCAAGKTFKYTETGSVGLLDGKKALHIQARGGVYSSGPAAEVEMGDKYLHTILNFIGIDDKQSVIVEGMNATPDKALEIKAAAIAEAERAAESF